MQLVLLPICINQNFQTSQLVISSSPDFEKSRTVPVLFIKLLIFNRSILSKILIFAASWDSKDEKVNLMSLSLSLCLSLEHAKLLIFAASWDFKEELCRESELCSGSLSRPSLFYLLSLSHAHPLSLLNGKCLDKLKEEKHQQGAHIDLSQSPTAIYTFFEGHVITKPMSNGDILKVHIASLHWTIITI